MNYRFILILFLFIGSNCSNSEVFYEKLSGTTMGTTYNIIVECSDPDQLKLDIEQELVLVNGAASTYESKSIISLFNKDYKAYTIAINDSKKMNQYFLDNFELASKIYQESNGAFDPTIMPVVNYWGFGYTDRIEVDDVDSAKVKELLSSVGFNKLHREKDLIQKENEKTELDFSAIAKGYGVDKIVQLLESNGIKNYYVEIGGEVFAKGKNDRGITWRTGIGVPSTDANPLEFQEILEIQNKGIATSGNYRNFYEVNGRMVSHTINPISGFPERNELLSATIIAPTCAEADGFATACMVLGREKAIKLIEDHKQLEGLLIFGGENGFYQVYDSTKK